MKNFKKNLSVLVVSLLISSLFFTGCGREEQRQSSKEQAEQMEVPIQINSDAQLSKDQSENLQTSLIILSDLYLRAAVATNIALSTTPENSAYEEWEQKTKESEKAWEKLEKELKRFEEIAKNLGVEKEARNPWVYSSVLNSAFADAPAPSLVTAVFDTTPANKRSLQNLMDFFGWDAKTALKQLKSAQSQIESDAWTEEGDANEMLQNQAKIISDTMKISLFIGGMGMGAGTTAPTMLGTAKSIFTTGSMVIEGADLAMAVGEDYMIIGGDEEGKATITQIRDKVLSKPCKIISILKLGDVTDTGNIITIGEAAPGYFDWESKMIAKVSATPSGDVIKFSKSNLTGDLQSINPEDLERFQYNTKKAWEELGMPEVIERAEKNMREQKKQVDKDIRMMELELKQYLQEKRQIEYDIERLKSAQGGTFTQVSPEALEKLSKQLEEINKKINALKTKIARQEELSNSLDLDNENEEEEEDDEDKEYPETLNAKGTWKSSHGESGEINISFPSAGGNFSGGFSSCPKGICWSSTASGTFDGNDPGKIEGKITGSIAATKNTPKFTISGTFKGDISLTNGTVSGTFSNSLSDASGQYGTYTDSGTWSATFDNGLD